MPEQISWEKIPKDLAALCNCFVGGEEMACDIMEIFKAELKKAWDESWTIGRGTSKYPDFETWYANAYLK